MDDEEDVPLSKADEIKEKLALQLPFLAKLFKKKAPDTSEKEDDLDEDAEEAPKKKLKVIHIIIILALAFIVLYDEVVPPEEPAVTTPKITPKYKKRPKKNKELTEPKEDTTIKKDVVERPLDEPVAPKEDEPSVLDEPAQDDTVTDDSFDIPKDTVAPKDDVEKELDALFDDDDLTAPEEKPSEKVEQKPTAVIVVEPEPSIDDDFDINSSGDDNDLLSFGDDIVNKVSEAGGSGEEITTAILEQLEKDAKKKRNKLINNKKVEPTDPPSYLAPGNGLVYNCVDRHWACIDSSSFKLCGDNYAWRLKKGESVQCYPSEFYDSTMDCESMQQYKIDMTAATDFCN